MSNAGRESASQTPHSATAVIKGTSITVMGLGSHGGGIATVRWLVAQGAEVTVTDTRNRQQLESSLKELRGLPVHYKLGGHWHKDFAECDMVIKNPAVPRSSPFLQSAVRIESDISLFLQRCPARIVAVTGTKGKSTTAGAIAHALREMGTRVHLGGNIGRSPLTFVDTLTPDDVVVLELSSFQLGDLTLSPHFGSSLNSFGRWGPAVSVITNIFNDHLDYYSAMRHYIADKRVITTSQSARDWLILSGDIQQRPYSEYFQKESKAQIALVLPEVASQSWNTHSHPLAWKQRIYPAAGEYVIEGHNHTTKISIESKIAGRHNRINLMYACMAVHALRVGADLRPTLFAQFSGLPHRMELVGSYRGSPVYNDSAATVPEATLMSVESCTAPVHLIAGGSDKGAHLELFIEITRKVHAIYLLRGSATERLVKLFESRKRAYHGVYNSLETAIEALLNECHTPGVILLSPGCASFGMFANEFQRGNIFRTLMQQKINHTQIAITAPHG